MTIAPELVVAAILFGLVILVLSYRRSGRFTGHGYQPVARSESPGPPPTGGTIAITITPRPVFHRQPKKNRRDALRPCNGIAFLTTRTDGAEIPQTCQTCGQPLQVRYLDFSQVVETRLSVDVARQPRHYGAKGTPVTEIER